MTYLQWFHQHNCIIYNFDHFSVIDENMGNNDRSRYIRSGELYNKAKQANIFDCWTNALTTNRRTDGRTKNFIDVRCRTWKCHNSVQRLRNYWQFVISSNSFDEWETIIKDENMSLSLPWEQSPKSSKRHPETGCRWNSFKDEDADDNGPRDGGDERKTLQSGGAECDVEVAHVTATTIDALPILIPFAGAVVSVSGPLTKTFRVIHAFFVDVMPSIASEAAPRPFWWDSPNDCRLTGVFSLFALSRRFDAFVMIAFLIIADVAFVGEAERNEAQNRDQYAKARRWHREKHLRIGNRVC